MKEYQSHKRVHAAKITKIEPDAGGSGRAALYFEDGPMTYVDAKYMTKHEPQVGWYYVVYPDGYESFSPAEPFEAGYTAVGEGPAPTVSRMVHYVAYGTPGGEYAAGIHRAAVITEVVGTHPEFIGLCVLNPTGIFFNDHVPYDGSRDPKPGTWHWPERV